MRACGCGFGSDASTDMLRHPASGRAATLGTRLFPAYPWPHGFEALVLARPGKVDSIAPRRHRRKAVPEALVAQCLHGRPRAALDEGDSALSSLPWRPFGSWSYLVLDKSHLDKVRLFQASSSLS